MRPQVLITDLVKEIADAAPNSSPALVGSQAECGENRLSAVAVKATVGSTLPLLRVADDEVTLRERLRRLP